MASNARKKKGATPRVAHPRPKANGPATVTLRLPRQMLERADALLQHAAHAPELSTAPTVTRSDVLRLAILRGLQVLDAEYEQIVDEGLTHWAEERMADPENRELVPLEQVLGRRGV